MKECRSTVRSATPPLPNLTHASRSSNLQLARQQEGLPESRPLHPQGEAAAAASQDRVSAAQPAVRPLWRQTSLRSQRGAAGHEQSRWREKPTCSTSASRAQYRWCCGARGQVGLDIQSRRPLRRAEWRCINVVKHEGSRCEGGACRSLENVRTKQLIGCERSRKKE